MKESRILAIALIFLCLLAAAREDSPIFPAYKGHVNGSTLGSKEIAPEMFKANPLESRFFMEIWFHDLIFEQEGIIFNMNFHMHNLGISRGYCDVFAMVSDPSSEELVLDKKTFSPGDVNVDKKGFGITAGPNRIELVGDRYRIKVDGPQLKAEFSYKPLAGSYRLGDGYVLFKNSDDFTRHSMPLPWAEVSGTLSYNGKTHQLKGYGSLNHEWQRLSPSRYMSRVRVMYLYTENEAIRISRVSSRDLDGQWVQALLIADRERVIFSSHDFKFEQLDVKPVPGAKVNCPRRFKVSAIHGDDRLEGEIVVKSIQEKKNILGDHNVVFQQIATLLINETWSYRFWADYDFTLVVDGESRKISGKGAGNFLDSTYSHE